MHFLDRRHAGDVLARSLERYAHSDAVVLGLPRGGVMVAAPIAERLGLPLDVVCVRKLGVPFHPELAMGAIASGGVRVLSDDVIEHLAIDAETVDAVTEAAEHELARRERAYRGHQPPVAVRGRTAILVDDGLATGASMLAAVRAVRKRAPARVVVAVPVGSPQATTTFASRVDDVVMVERPERLDSVGAWYAEFGQNRDDEVRDALQSVHHARA